MKLKLLTLLLLLPVASVAWAQSKDGSDESTFPGNLFPKKTYSQWSLGVFAGPASNHHVIDVAYATDMKYTDKSGYSVGVGASFHPTGWLALRADVAMVQKNPL